MNQGGAELGVGLDTVCITELGTWSWEEVCVIP